jgi:hypothetical protein
MLKSVSLVILYEFYHLYIKTLWYNHTKIKCSSFRHWTFLSAVVVMNMSIVDNCQCPNISWSYSETFQIDTSAFAVQPFLDKPRSLLYHKLWIFIKKNVCFFSFLQQLYYTPFLLKQQMFFSCFKENKLLTLFSYLFINKDSWPLKA